MAESPDLTIYAEPSVRAYTEWGPENITTAELSADSGSLRLAADLWQEMISADDRLASVVSQRCDALLGCELKFEASAGDGRRRRKALRALEAEEDFYDSFPETSLKQLISWGFGLGVGVAEKRWTQKGDRVIPVIDVKHPRNLRYDWQKRTWMLTVEVDGRTTEIAIAPGDPKWIIFTPYGTSRPWAHGLWRACARWYLLKRYAISDWGRYSEMHGKAIIVGTTPPGASKEVRARLRDDIEDIGRETAMAIPTGFDIKLVEATANTWTTYQAQIGAANTAYAVAVVRQNLTTEVQGGSFAAAQVSQQVAIGCTKFDNGSLGTCLHDQALGQWAEYNFGDAALAPWPSWNVEPPEDLATKATTLATLATALGGFGNAGARVDVDALLEEFGVPILESGLEKDDSAPFFAYDYTASILTYNEARKKKGLPPVAWGNVPISPFGPPPSSGATPPPAQTPFGAASRWAAPVVVRQLAAEPASTPAPRIPRRASTAGQTYADTVASNAARAAAASLSGDVAAVLAAIGDDDAPLAERAGAIKSKLVTALKSMDPAKPAALVEQTLLVSHLAGRTAVVEDTEA